MKLEKLNDNQIRCTLNRADLAERELKLSELAYGTEKAKNLFREMMQQASFEFGFEAEDIPLMIEAIPVSADCIILVITKVEDPEELDTRFSKFAPSKEDESDNLIDSETEEDEIAALFNKIQEIRDTLELDTDTISKVEKISESSNSQDDFVPFKDSLKKTSVSNDTTESSPNESFKPIIRIFAFDSFEKVNTACEIIKDSFTAQSSLYKDYNTNTYYLVFSLSDGDTDSFNRACSAISEFGTRTKATYATESFYKEHYETIIRENAVSILGNL